MTPPLDLEAIRKRHEHVVTCYGDEPWTPECIEDGEQAHADRGALIDALRDARNAALEEAKKAALYAIGQDWSDDTTPAQMARFIAELIEDKKSPPQ